jgi:hypothetical protein
MARLEAIHDNQAKTDANQEMMNASPREELNLAKRK